MQRHLTYSGIHLWIPNIFEFKGGIQTYSSYLLQAIQASSKDTQFDIFLKHDRTAHSDYSYSSSRFHCCGKWHSQLRTLAYAITLTTYGVIYRPSLIVSTHLHFAPVGYWLKRVARIPYWVVVHGVDAWNIQDRVLISSLQHADRILAVSTYTRDRLLKEQELESDKIVILPNTFDEVRFQIQTKSEKLLQRYGLKSTQPIILTVARLEIGEQYKGYDKVLQALPYICKRIPDVHYLLVGKGDDLPRIKQLIHELNLQGCVTLTGFIPDEELADHYNLCDVFAMPSKGEGFGIVYLEALACGKPVLGGNQDGAIDALCHGELGALVNPDDLEEITQTLIQILQGTYPNSLMYQSQQLRQQVIDTYGFKRFQATLASYLQASN